MTSGVMGLTADEFWTDPDRTRDEAAELASRSDWRGYAIDAPSVIDLGRRDTLPVVGVRSLSAVDCALHDFQRNAVVVAARLESAEVFVGRAFELKYARPSQRPRRPPPVTVTITDTFSFELRARLAGLPWGPGTLRVYLLVHDRVAEPIEARLVAPAGPDLHAGPVYEAPWPPPGDGRPPTYERTAASPAVPAAPGISMVADRVVLNNDRAWCVVQGSFRLPAQSASLRSAPALVPLTLVLTGAALTDPWTCTVALPSGDVARAPGELVTGCFTLDLFTLPGAPREPGTYHLWAFAGAYIAGPEAVALVPEERLAPA